MDRKIFSKKRIAAQHQRLVLGSFSWLFASLFLYKDNNTTLHKASPVPCARIFVVPCEIEAATRSLVVKARACQAPWLQPAVIPRESQWQQRIYLWKAGYFFRDWVVVVLWDKKAEMRPLVVCRRVPYGACCQQRHIAASALLFARQLTLAYFCS